MSSNLYDGDKIGEGDASSVSSGSQSEVLARFTGADGRALAAALSITSPDPYARPYMIWIHAPAQ